MASGTSPVLENPMLHLLLKKLNRVSPAKLNFITVRDNTSNGKWTKIGKVNDWIRRFSDNYYIVRGTKGGSHYHAICEMKKGKSIRYQKGIHINVRPVTDAKPMNWTRPTLCEVMETQHGRDMRDHILETNVMKYSTPISHVIAQMIQKYWKKKRNRAKREKKKLILTESLRNIIKYMDKNLLEPRPEELREYYDYIIRYMNI